MPGPPDIAISRSVEEFAEPLELTEMERDAREEARRALLQDHHDAQIKKLEEERDRQIQRNAELQKQLRITRGRVTKALEAQNRRSLLVLVLMIAYLFGTNPTAQQLILLIFQGLTKGVVK